MKKVLIIFALLIAFASILSSCGAGRPVCPAYSHTDDNTSDSEKDS